MNKGLILFGCLFSNVVIFGRCCCKDDNNKSKSSAESVEAKFKKLVCRCFGLQDSDIISVKSSDKYEDIDAFFPKNELDESVGTIYHKIGSKFLYCLLRNNIAPDVNLVAPDFLITDGNFKYLEKGFYIAYPSGVPNYFTLKLGK